MHTHPPQHGRTGKRAKMPIPKFVQQHIDAAFPSHVCLVGTCLPTGFAQISPRGSVQIYDDDHISFWDRGGGSTAAGLIDGSKVRSEERRVGKEGVGACRYGWSPIQ